MEGFGLLVLGLNGEMFLRKMKRSSKVVGGFLVFGKKYLFLM